MDQSVTTGPARSIPLVQVLGAVAYGEEKAHEAAVRRAEAATDPAGRRVWRTIAAEELRHHKGFVRRLRALGADPDRAMAPYRASLDTFHGMPDETDEIAGAVCDLLGEGIASDLLRWLRRVVDPETAAFIDTVLADEAAHEARAVDELRRLVDGSPEGRARAAAGARRMLVRMALSAPGSGPSFTAFLRAGRPRALLHALTAGYVRRVRAAGVGPLAVADDLRGIVWRALPLTSLRG